MYRVFFFLILFFSNQNIIIYSKTLQLQSSNAHINLFQIIRTLNQKDFKISFYYKPLNTDFVLLSGTIKQNNETAKLIKFNYEVNKRNNTIFLLKKYDNTTENIHQYFKMTKIKKRYLIEKEIYEKLYFLENINGKKKNNSSINRCLLKNLTHQNCQSKNLYLNENNWKKFFFVLNENDIKIGHIELNKCNKDENQEKTFICNYYQDIINYNNLSDFKLDHLLIGKEFSLEDLNQSINLEEKKEFLQLNETFEKHINSKIHENSVNYHSKLKIKNQEKSFGLIGCLSFININDKELSFKNNENDFFNTLTSNFDKLEFLNYSYLKTENFKTKKKVNETEDWWELSKYNKSQIFLGKIKFNYCDQLDSCSKNCLHDAACKLNADGESICHCDSVGYAGKNCYFRFRTSGVYIIDPDGPGPYPASHVYCKFEQNKKAQTLIYHNLADETVVRNQNYNPFFMKLRYRDFNQTILSYYMSLFETCKQEIRYDCYKVPFRFGDLAWFRIINSSKAIEIFDKSHFDIESNLNKNCYLKEDIWSYENITLYNSSVIEVYFLPTKNLKNNYSKINQEFFFTKWYEQWFKSSSSVDSLKQLKAIAGKRKKNSEARLSISPLICSGYKQRSHEVAFSTESSFIEINYKDLIDKNLIIQKKNNFSIDYISFNFRTLQSKPGILIHLTLKPEDTLFYEIMLKNEYEIEIYYPHLKKMNTIKLKSIQRLNTGEWQLVQVFFSDEEMRVSINTVSIIFDFDKKSIFNFFKETIYVGGVPKLFGNQKSKIGFIGCFRDLSFTKNLIINLKNFIHPRLIKQILPTCKRMCNINPCKNDAVCVEHWSFRKCVCRNRFAHLGFNCELNLNKNSITIITEKPFIHLFINRNFNKFISNELNEFINKNTIHTLIDLNAKQLVKNGILDTSGDLNQVNVTGVRNLHKSEEKRWIELLKFINGSFNNSINNQLLTKIIEPPYDLGLDRWNAINKGKLKMNLYLEFRTRVNAGLLFYANDNLNNFIQLHFVEKKRLCLTFNLLDKIIRTEIFFEEDVLNSGESIQLRVQRYSNHTVFNVLIYFEKRDHYMQKSIYIKLPLQFLTNYSHKPFKINEDFDYYYKLETENNFKFVNFDDINEKKKNNSDETLNVKILKKIKNHGEFKESDYEFVNNQKNNLNKKENIKELEPLVNVSSILTDSFPISQNKNIFNTNSYNNLSLNNSKSLPFIETNNINLDSNKNKFAEQVIPVRGYYKLQVYLPLIIEMTDNAETYDGLIKNLDKILDDEKMFLKPLNLIFLSSLENSDIYFGLNKTLNTSSTSISKNLPMITDELIQNKSVIAPLLKMINSSLINTKYSLNNLSKLNLSDEFLAKKNENNFTNNFSEKVSPGTNYTQIYIGNVDGNNTLSSLPGFVGCISGVVFNNQLINLTKIVQERYEEELKTGKILNGCNMLCSIKNCQNSGKCLDNWITNRTFCDCNDTSYTGDRCNDDLGSVFNSYNHLFYRLDARKNLLEDHVKFELAFSFNYNEYFNEKNRYYHQDAIEENILHNSNAKFFDNQVEDVMQFEKRIILLIIYETRYILLQVNEDNNLILSDVDNKGNELKIVIENNLNNSFFNEHRHYIRYNRKTRTVLLDDKVFKVNPHKDAVKHFYLPNQASYGIYVAGKPKRDRRFSKLTGFSGCISNVIVNLNNQVYEPFYSAFNAINISYVTIKNSIRQAKCAEFITSSESKKNSLPYRKKELLNYKWNTPEPKKVDFEHSAFFQNEESNYIFKYSFVLISSTMLLIILASIYMLILTLKLRKKIFTKNFCLTGLKSKSKSLDSVYEGEIRLLMKKRKKKF